VAQTVLLDIPTTLFLGHVMAFSAQRRDRDHVTPFTPGFRRATGYALFLFVPVAGYFYYAFPDWSWVYLVPDPGQTRPLGPLVLAAYAAGMFYGYLVAQAALRKALRPLFLGSLTVSGALLALTFVLTRHQYLHVGNYAQYHAGTAPVIFHVPDFMLRLNLGGVVMIGGAVAIIGWNWWEGRTPAGPPPGP
jgi:hypothetical protein